MDILTTDNLCKTYYTEGDSVKALKNVNLTIKREDFIAIVGPSGSGKSTLLHLLGGLDRPTSGSVTIEGQDIYSLKEKELSIMRRRKFGFIFQSYNLLPVLSARENIMLPLLLENRQVDKEYVDDIIELLGLKDRCGHLPGALSGGQQQRVAIARALSNKPSIIFADEPTGNLDSKSGKEVLDLLKISAARYHQTIVMITHDMGIACDAGKIIRIIDGEVSSCKEVEV